MNDLLTTNNITFVVGMLGIVFGVYHFFRNPQIDGDKRDAVLAQQLQWTTESNERRFKEMQDSIKDAFSLASNHTHTVEVKVDALSATTSSLSTQIAVLAKIIDERVPKK